jgi:sugar lactone lactonase YvrE
MLRVTRVLEIVVAAGLLAAACAPAPTSPPPTLAPTRAPTIVPTVAPTVAPTAVPATARPTLAPTAVRASPTAAPASTATAAADAGVLATQFKFDNPQAIAIDAAGNLYIAGCPYGADVSVYAVDQTGLLKVYAGSGEGFGGDGGPALRAQFWCGTGLALDSAGNLYIVDEGNNRIRRIEAKTGTISTVAGSGAATDISSNGPATGGFAGDGGPATAALLSQPNAIAWDRQGNLYILDRDNNRVRKVDPAGMITTFAGVGTWGFSGDGGPATKAELSTSNGIAVDAAGNVYIADSDNARIRKVDLQGIITTIAGTGKPGFSGDGGRARAAQLSNPWGLAFDGQGNLYVADGPTLDFDGNRIRKIDAAGMITTVAGSGEGGNTGDGRLATAARLFKPTTIAFDAQGNLYFADSGNNAVRKVDKAGIITTVAGGG